MTVGHAPAARTPAASGARWVLLAVGAVIVVVAAYLAAVRTATGQRVENAALRGALQVNADEVTAADEALATFTLASLGIAVAILAVIGWVRGGLRLAAVAVGVVGVATVLTEVLKRYVLERPLLIEAPEYLRHNSFPSGHTTVAMSVACATLMVVSWRWRTLAMLLVTSWTVGVGAYTVVARWHRLSDTVGADAIALLTASLGALVLLRWRMVRRVPADRSAPIRTIVVILACLWVVVIGALGIFVGLAGAGEDPGATADYNIYLGAQALASVGSVLALLLAWASWHRLETARPA
ncbi:phosphatase PAP2 family protein [Gordonia caeni]|uniref:Phosphatidic acid phosphatase type 2/haloperoxidase domain-containing protein n=1 Tax=Gordonia caeni TaxID=1007097 RepID=A0ABP7PE24_9ACTN